MPILANRYQLIEPIYDDGTVIAYRAYDQILNRTVTAETLSLQATTEHIERLTEKARRAALTRLAHVAKLYDQNIDADRPFLIWEDKVGPTLAEAAPLSAGQAIDAVCIAATILQTALAHRQRPPMINPQTVCIDPMGRVQILDLGLHQLNPSDRQAISMLGNLLHSALGQDNRAQASLQALMHRAQKGSYATIDEFIADLRQVRQRFDAPTIMVPYDQRLAKEASPAPARSGTPLGTATSAHVKRHPVLWLALAAIVASLILVFGTTFWRDQINIDRVINLAPLLGPPATTSPTTPGAAPNPRRSEFEIGEPYIVNTNTGQPVRVRSGPGLAFEPITSVPFGGTVEVIGGPQPADGYNWVQVRAAGVEGWCISEALRKR